MKKDYMDLVKEKGLYNALLELETDALLEFIGLTKSEIAKMLKIQRTTLQWKIKKLDLGHLFPSGTFTKKGDIRGNIEKIDQNKENNKEEI